MVDAILTSIIDIVKYKVSKDIHFSDNIMNTMVVALILSVITLVFPKIVNKGRDILRYVVCTLILRHPYWDIRKYKWFGFDEETNDRIKNGITMYLHCSKEIDYRELEKISNNMFNICHYRLCELEINGKYDRVKGMYMYIVYCDKHRNFIVYVYRNYSSKNEHGNIDILNQYQFFYESQSSLDEFYIFLGLKAPPRYDVLEIKELVPNDTLTSTLNNEDNFSHMFFPEKESIINALDNVGNENIGFILSGKFGTGKTSFIRAVCNHTRRSALLISFTAIDTATKLFKLTDTYPFSKYVYVFDEFDMLLTDIKEMDKTILTSVLQKSTDITQVKSILAEEKDKLCIRSLMTWLDGVHHFQNRIIIATTNASFPNEVQRDISPESSVGRIVLPEGLIRDGRFDWRIRFEEITKDHTILLLQDKLKITLNETQISRVPHKKFVPSYIVSLIKKYKEVGRVLDELNK